MDGSRGRAEARHAGVLPRAVGILGGMGPAAGADFARLFVQACADWLQAAGRPVHDQAFPPHWLAQLPLPDRTQALMRGGAAFDATLAPMREAIGRLRDLGAVAVAMACNTAHAWHAPLQDALPAIELLHIADETAAQLRARGVTAVGLMATQGTYQQQLYDRALERAGIACHRPDEAGRELLMRGIYAGVKTGDFALAERCFVTVGEALRARHGELPLIMGCTEIPLALEGATAARDWSLINPAQVLAQALARRAYGEVCGSRVSCAPAESPLPAATSI
jgi:aspartate racemase